MGSGEVKLHDLLVTGQFQPDKSSICTNAQMQKFPFCVKYTKDYSEGANRFSDLTANRRQFSLAVCFAMTINKSQGQLLSKVGLYLREPVFTHGQLYVALSRVKSRDGLKLLILDKDKNLTNKTCNVVFKKVFDSV
ncbi:hypothetical protein LXL04_007644 [Taraxacum kok-saghyz]